MNREVVLFSRLSLKAKLVSAFGSVIAVFTLGAIGSHYLLSSVHETTKRVKDESTPMLLLAENIAFQVSQVQQFLTDVSATREKDAYPEAQQAAESFEQDISKLKAYYSKKNDITRLTQVQEIQKQFNSFYELGKRMSEAYIEGGVEAGNLLMEPFDHQAEVLVNVLEPFKQQILETNDQSIQEIVSASQQTQQIMLISLLIGTAVSGLIAYLLTKDILRSIGGEPSQAAVNMLNMAEGNLQTPQSYQHTNSLMHSMANFCSRIRSVISDVNRTTDAVHKSSQEFLAFAQHLSSETNQQSVTSSQTAQQIKELSASAQTVSNYSMDNKTQATSSMVIAQQGAQLMESLLSKVEQMSLEMQKSTSEINSLVERSDQINRIVSVIHGIAEQTNLLALNAAIEAARAGAEGRGFAVVADEVRKLASNTSNATTEIRSLIGEICNSSERSKQSVTQAEAQVHNTVEYANELKAGLSNIIHALQESVRNTERVDCASKAQLQVTLRIEEQLIKMAGDSGNISQSGKELTHKAQNLAELSSQLKQASGFFKV